jgi:hypothetical protein
MSPPATALVIPVGPDEDEQPSGRVQLASQWELELEANRRERRIHRRHRVQELQWLRSARLGAGHRVSILDLSAGGALVDSPVPLRPDSILTLDIIGRGFDKSIPFRVLRCQIVALLPERTVYRGACEFTSLIELPVELSSAAKVLYPDVFVSLDVALKQLVERIGAPRQEPGNVTFGLLDARTVREALKALQDRAMSTPLDPMAHPLAALIGRVIPALEPYRGLRDVIEQLEGQLRQTVPQVSLRLVAGREPAVPGKKSILIKVPGARAESALVSIDLPRGLVLNDWQTRVLRVTSRLIALLQRLEPDALGPPTQNDRASDQNRLPVKSVASEPASTDQPTSAWQKIVVRYTEGQLLKGYTHDFSPARQQFSLWPSPGAAPHERVIVPLARLKGVFFVRDFDGNPGYVECVDSTDSHQGRRIEVTLVDDEVIAGRTLTYRPDGHGFFVTPADPLANNIRVFVVASSVRQVRFPE